MRWAVLQQRVTGGTRRLPRLPLKWVSLLLCGCAAVMPDSPEVVLSRFSSALASCPSLCRRLSVHLASVWFLGALSSDGLTPTSDSAVPRVPGRGRAQTGQRQACGA